MPRTLQDVINYIYKRKDGTGLEKWSLSQVGAYVYGHMESKTIRVSWDDKDAVTGVIIFDPGYVHGFYVDQFWADNKSAVADFLLEFQRCYPGLDTILGWRTNKLVSFKLSTLIKIYGRRSSSTTRARVNLEHARILPAAVPELS